ncbi:hypothetical protein J1614_007912 [Plenodomus biglobosus]|nr:hypothetical protein J1614_007912 [Plenodomus biglobosus]
MFGKYCYMLGYNSRGLAQIIFCSSWNLADLSLSLFPQTRFNAPPINFIQDEQSSAYVLFYTKGLANSLHDDLYFSSVPHPHGAGEVGTGHAFVLTAG